MKFSVLISVYYKENPVFLRCALTSLVQQTLIPSEIVLVKDGPLSKDLDLVIDDFTINFPLLFKIVTIEKNKGLGSALRLGLQHCSHNIVARMDSDDICFSQRFQKQLDFLLENRDIVLVGSTVKEFNTIPNDLNQYRILPVDHDHIVSFSKRRSPFNHPSIMFNKEAINEVGSYKSMLYFEDYYLWLRLLKKGYRTANILEPLLYMRIGNDMIGRRHGWKYLKKEYIFYKQCLTDDLISKYDFLSVLITRLPLRMLPKKILNYVYKKILR